MIGRKFGRWTVIGSAPDYVSPSGKHSPKWKCQCECGRIKNVRESSLLNGESQSCGCLRKELISERAGKHYGFGTRLYNVWDSARQRCYNKKCKAYPDYGGRGIKMCKEWDDFATFKEWAMNNGYDPDAPKGQCTLDRIDVNKDYCPENCRWISLAEQNRNKTTSIHLTANGETHTLKEWANITGIRYQTLYKRYHNYGWVPEKVIS